MVIMEIFKDGKLSQTSHSSGVLWVLDGDVLPSRTRTQFLLQFVGEAWKILWVFLWRSQLKPSGAVQKHVEAASHNTIFSIRVLLSDLNHNNWILLITRNQDLPSSLSVSDKLSSGPLWDQTSTGIISTVIYNHLTDSVTRNFWNLFFEFTIKTWYMCVYLNKGFNTSKWSFSTGLLWRLHSQTYIWGTVVQVISVNCWNSLTVKQSNFFSTLM